MSNTQNVNDANENRNDRMFYQSFRPTYEGPTMRFSPGVNVDRGDTARGTSQVTKMYSVSRIPKTMQQGAQAMAAMRYGVRDDY